MFPPLPKGNIYIALTGGVESTLVFWLLLSLYDNPIKPCTYTWGDRRKWEIHNATRIARLLGGADPIIAGHSDKFTTYNAPTVEQYFNRENKVFDKVRQDPSFVAGFTGKNTTTLDPEIITPEAQQYYLNRFSIHRPFLMLDKAHTIDLYYKLNVEHLLSHTHSCITRGNGHCGSCHACYERTEAFDRLGRKDPAIYMQDYDSLVNKVRRFYDKSRRRNTYLF